jgi:hypothetical protein
MSRRISCLPLIAITFACAGAADVPDSTTVQSTASPVDSMFAVVADSEWVDVRGLTLVGFYPVRTNEQLEKDEGLATALDDFAYHIGTAMDSLIAIGVTVHYRGGDTLWFRTPSHRWRFVRSSDSAEVGYVFVDTTRNSAPLYGVRGYVDLIEYAREFKTTGQVRPR